MRRGWHHPSGSATTRLPSASVRVWRLTSWFFERRLGKQRVEERLLPYGDLVRSGASVNCGADLPGVDIDECPPLFQLEAAVTRKRPGFPNDRAQVARQGMTVKQAIQAYTINGAYQLRMEHMIGSIEVGKQADLVVLGKSLFDVPPEQIHNVPVPSAGVRVWRLTSW